MGDEAAHPIVQPSGKLCTTRPDLRARRTRRQHDLTTATNNDNDDSTSQMSKRRKNTQEMHKSAMSLPVLAGRPIHGLMR
jgi:hypothetical protein